MLFKKSFIFLKNVLVFEAKRQGVLMQTSWRFGNGICCTQKQHI